MLIRKQNFENNFFLIFFIIFHYGPGTWGLTKGWGVPYIWGRLEGEEVGRGRRTDPWAPRKGTRGQEHPKEAAPMPSHTRTERAKRRAKPIKRRQTPKIGTRVRQKAPSRRRVSGRKGT